MTLDWEAHRDRLKDLWITQNRTQDEIASEMKRSHNFIASKNQYSARFKQWGWRKNITVAEWKVIEQTLMRRGDEGKKSGVYLNDVRIPDEKLRKDIARHVPLSSKFTSNIPDPGPPTFEHIQIRTPSPVLTQTPPDAVPSTINNSVILPGCKAKRKRSAQIVSSPPRVKMHCTSERNMDLYQTRNTQLVPSVSGQLPYFEFLDSFRSLHIGESVFNVKFFDEAPSPLILPSDPLLLADTPELGWALDMSSDNYWVEGSMEYASNQLTTGKFYESFANFLIPLDYENQDRLDANRRLQEQLPTLLANIPERYEGESKSNMDLLLGPPQLAAAIRLLEIVVYLFSNGLLRIDERWHTYYGGNTGYIVLDWIVKTIPCENLGIILQKRLPTLQAFQSELFLFGIETSNVCLARALLDLDVGLQDFILTSSDPLVVAVGSGHAEILSLLLSVGINLELEHCPIPWDVRRYSERLTIEMARLLINAGANASFFGYNNGKDSCGPLPFAVKRGDTELVQLLLSVGVDVNSRWRSRESPYCLRIAAENGQIGMLHLLLEYGENVHAACEGPVIVEGTRWHQYTRGFTATVLQSAAATGNVEMVKLLLEVGSNINEPAHGKDGQTALYVATHTGHIQMVEFLLKSGANANAPGTSCHKYQRPPLLAAVERQDLPIAKILLQYGADPNVPAFGYYGTTILQAARILKPHSTIVSALVTAGANDALSPIDLVSDGWMKIQLIQAILNGDDPRIDHLLRAGMDLDMKPIETVSKVSSAWVLPARAMTIGTVLHWAIASTQIGSATFQLLVSHIQNVNDSHYANMLPPSLHEAVCRKNLDFAKVLLDAGADINASSSHSLFDHPCTKEVLPTALHVAAYKQDGNMVALLLERGADPNRSLPAAGTPLQTFLNGYSYEGAWRAALGPNLDLFEVLLGICSNSEALDVITPYHGTMLQRAVLGAQHDGSPWMTIIRRLLDLGANVNVPAIGRRDDSIRRRFTALQSACQGSNLNLIKLLLDYGADINAPPATEGWGLTALQAACESGNIDLVKFLLDCGAELNARPAQSSGGTALQLASCWGHIKVAQYLLSKGAHVNAPGSEDYGRTALEWAGEDGRLDMVQILIDAGADSHLPLVKRYASSILLARQHGRLGVVSLLQRRRNELREQWDLARVHEIGQDDSSEEDWDKLEYSSDDSWESDDEDN